MGPLIRVEKAGVLYSIIIKHNFTSQDKYNFITPNENFLQIGINYYQADEVINDHIHLEVDRHVTRTEEIVMLRKGRMLATVYDEHKVALGEYEMETGDTLYLMKGGHGFKLLEPCEIFEVKQGPYISKTADKELF